MTTLTRRWLAADGIPCLLALLVAVVVFSALAPDFLSVQNVRNVLVQSTFVLLTAVGMTFVLTAGAIDLSVGSVLGLSAGVTILTLALGAPSGVAILAGLAVGVALGALNGVLVAWFGLNDFIVTLGTLGLAGGTLQLLDAARPLRASGGAFFSGLANGLVLGVPVPVIISVLVVAIMGGVLRQSSFGRRVRAVGMNRAAAGLAGIDTRAIRFLVFVLSGLFAALAGVLMASRLSSVSAGLGQGFELQAIAAAVVGGTSLSGGRGTVLGAALAAVLLGTISTGLQITGVDATWFKIVVGASIVGAVAFHQWSVGFVAIGVAAAPPAAPAAASGRPRAG